MTHSDMLYYFATFLKTVRGTRPFFDARRPSWIFRALVCLFCHVVYVHVCAFLGTFQRFFKLSLHVTFVRDAFRGDEC